MPVKVQKAVGHDIPKTVFVFLNVLNWYIDVFSSEKIFGHVVDLIFFLLVKTDLFMPSCHTLAAIVALVYSWTAGFLLLQVGENDWLSFAESKIAEIKPETVLLLPNVWWLNLTHTADFLWAWLGHLCVLRNLGNLLPRDTRGTFPLFWRLLLCRNHRIRCWQVQNPIYHLVVVPFGWFLTAISRVFRVYLIQIPWWYLKYFFIVILYPHLVNFTKKRQILIVKFYQSTDLGFVPNIGLYEETHQMQKQSNFIYLIEFIIGLIFSDRFLDYRVCEVPLMKISKIREKNNLEIGHHVFRDKLS